MKSEFEIFTDILRRGGVRYSTQEWFNSRGDTGTSVIMHDWSDEIAIDFYDDGRVYEVKIPEGYA